MKHLTLLLLFMLMSVSTFANQTGNNDFNDEDELFDTIAGGDEGFEFIKYTPEFIQMSIHEDMKVACKKALCTLFSIDQAGDEFKVEFKAGIGEEDDGLDIQDLLTGNYNNNSNGPSPFVGLTVSYTYNTCAQSIRVPKSLYIAMNTYMYNLITEEGSTKRALTPADEAMIIFYSTIIKQATGCKK